MLHEVVLFPLLQAEMPIARVTRSRRAPRNRRSLRRPGAMPNNRTHARTAPPPEYSVRRCEGMSLGNSFEAVHGGVLLAVVEMVMVADLELPSVILTGEVEPKANVGGSFVP